MVIKICIIYLITLFQFYKFENYQKKNLNAYGFLYYFTKNNIDFNMKAVSTNQKQVIKDLKNLY